MLVSTQRQYKFALLTPVFAPPRLNSLSIHDQPSRALVDSILNAHPRGDVMAIDLETCGGDPAVTGSFVVGVGLSNMRGSHYLSFRTENHPVYQYLLDRLLELGTPLIAHNQFFDGSYLYRDSGWQWHNWQHCTYALYKLLATEGYIGQRWGLKQAQVELLGWEESNEKDLSQWLVDNGYGSQIIMKETGEAVLRPDKGEMWRAPADILGHYCALDADSTYLLYSRVLIPALEKFNVLKEYAGDIYQQYLRVLIRQRFTGIHIDREALLSHDQYLEQSIHHLEQEFLSHELVAPHIAAYRQLAIDAHMEKQPEKFIKKKMGSEPAKYKKDGTLSKNWEKWKQKLDAPDVVSKNWERWQERLLEIESSQPFNINSNQQKQWLFYDRLENPVLLTTDSGQPATDEKALKGFGAPGAILIQQNEYVKERGYVEAVLSKSTTGTLHPAFKVPGTYTGRLAGAGGINVQQMPKSRSFLECWSHRRGKKWVQMDFCLHPDVEYLTRSGWKTADKLTREDAVWQVDPETLEGSWTVPSRIVWREYTGPMYEIGNRRGRLRVTENHRMLWTTQKHPSRKYRYTIRQSQDGIPSSGMATIQTSSTSSQYPSYTPSLEELNMACMIQADGTQISNSTYSIQVSYPEKREEVARLLGRRGTVRPPRDKQTLETETWSGAFFASTLLRKKSLHLEHLCSSMADRLVECLAKWDGSIGRSKEVYYSSTDIYSIEQVQMYLVRNGYECKVREYQPKYPGAKLMYVATIRKSKGIRTRKGIDDSSSSAYSGFVGCITVPTGVILVRDRGQTFITGNCALEQVVLAELSRDPALWKLYGPTAKKNDVYLFTGSQLPVIGDVIQAAGYDPNNPTSEGIANAKKQAKKERGIAKVITLASSYGAGPKKIQQTLQLEGIPISLEECQRIHGGYWQLYSGVKEYEQELLRQYNNNNGWVLNGIGRPLGIDFDKEKDIVNRVVQSTGHDILVLWLTIYSDLLNEAGIPWTPIIADLHDESIIEVDEGHAEQALRIMAIDAMQILNDGLRGRIPLKGEGQIADSLADIKIEG